MVFDDFTIEEYIEPEKIKKIKNKIILKLVKIEEDKRLDENVITCECGITIKKSSKSSHLKSKKHTELLEKNKNQLLKKLSKNKK
jgi:fructose-specific phosphotransferase system component IIB